MNILYLTINPNRQSTTVPTEEWFKILGPKGLRPVLVSHTIGDFHRWALKNGIDAYQIDLSFPDKLRPWRFLKSLWHIRKLVIAHKIQLIHCNEQDVYPIGQYAARICHLPVVVTVHCKMERDFCKWAFKKKRQPEKIFFVSSGSMEVCRSALNGIIPESKWKVLHNGLDLKYYKPDPVQRSLFREKYNSKSEFLIGVACALRPGKQLEHLIEAVSRLHDLKLKVLLAGFSIPGDEIYARNIIEKANQKLGNKFIFLGRLDDLRKFYNGLDLCINTSLEESFSISVLEALACGCPVVGYPSVTVSEAVLPSGGEILEQDNIDQLTRTVQQWLSNSERLASARVNAHKQAEKFDIRKISEQLWREYQSILNGSNYK